MEYLLLEHPGSADFFYNRSGCEDIADYLEVNEQRGEDFICADHTSSERRLQRSKGVSVVANRTGADLLPDPAPQATQIDASERATSQPMLPSVTSRAVMPYACTTVHGGSPLQTRAIPELNVLVRLISRTLRLSFLCVGLYTEAQRVMISRRKAYTEVQEAVVSGRDPRQGLLRGIAAVVREALLGESRV